MKPPQSKDAEQSLLGALVCDPSMYHLIAGLITADSFYSTRHQQIYMAIEGLIKEDVPLDIVSLSDKINGKISPAELLEIIDTQPTGANAEYYAEIVADKYTRRQIITNARQTLEAAVSGDTEIVDIITTAQKGLDLALPSRSKTSDAYPEILDVMEYMIDLPGSGKVNYIPTGFSKVDQQAKLIPGTLTMIAADPGVGKTSYILDVARYMSKHGHRPLVVTLEMTRKQILENVIAQELKICHQDMISGLLTNEQYSRLKGGLNKFSELNIGVLDGRWSTGEIRHQVATEKRTKGIDCLMVDSLGKVDHKGKNPDRLNIAYNDICADLVDIAVEFNIPVIVTHHLNKAETRRGKNNRPTIYSLNEAGDKWTHNVFLLYREYLQTQNEEVEGEAELMVAKARDGRVGWVQLGFDGPCKTFRGIEEHREPPRVMAGGIQ